VIGPVMHVDTELVAFLEGALGPPDRARVARHLEDCAECQATAAAFRELLAELTSTAPEPPGIRWERYDAELRAKLRPRDRRWSVLPASWPRLRPLPIGLTAAAAGIVIVLAVLTGDWGRNNQAPDLVVLEQTVIGGRLDLLRNYDLVEGLDLLEDLDVIRQLDGEG
jgi:anti-sigma factor RsiW